MTTATSSFSIEPGAEPLPGYRLEKRIGSGGYGDVWKASAPGGLPKAIKIIHGDVDGDRAVRELRSLDRAKSLNHPFLLSIERIEIVDGHLLIVTELADATLRDRFEQCREEALEGIPRDELLDYMREAADALDYLFDSHALQHLDIKPENLLLRGKHVKVADFGLLKNLQESCASLVNGMTPKYSAPELFEGKPGRHSDQYSLAIVYHEMVSGRMPFSGSNIASLASQHLHAAPDLSALAPVERFAVGKALSKDPQHRYPSCRAFVERLMHRSASMVMPDTRSSAGVVQDRSQSARQKTPSKDGDSHHDGHTIEAAAPEIRDLPRLLPPEAPISFRPVLFVGIGGTGGRVLRKLRQLITDRLGEAKGLPAIQFLYVDTDEDGLAGVVKGPSNEGLDPDEILITRLRQTQDYRNAVVSTLDSVSRRWIYNVPRSLRTQGLRALGRLAFLDNVEPLLDRMRRAVINATHCESVAATAEQSGLGFSETDPRVFVVAAIGGGTGSGMVLDAGYAIRQVLAECGFTDDYICGILTCSTTSSAGPAGVAPANAFACLEELRYFAQPGCDYPGEPKCGLAGFRGDSATFRSTYLFDVPAGKSDDATKRGFDQLAEYLFLSAVSPTSALLDESRRLEREESHAEGLRLRTAGVCPLAAATTEDPAPLAEQLCRLLVRKWRTGSDSAVQSPVKPTGAGRPHETIAAHSVAADTFTSLGQAEMDRLGVTLLALRERLVAVLSNKLGLDPRMYLRQVIDDSLSTAGRDQSRLMPAAGLALARLRAIAGIEKGHVAQGANPVESLAEFLQTQARVIGAQLGESIASWILKLADARSSSVDGARRAVTWVGDFVRALKQAAVEQVETARRDTESSAKILAGLESQPRAVTKEAIAETLSDHAERDLSILLHEGIGVALRAVEPFVTATSDQLGEILKDLNQLAAKFGGEKDGAGQDISKAATGRLSAQGPPRMADMFANQQRDLIEELNQAIEEQFFQDGRGLREILLGGSRLREELAAQMRATARRLVWRAYHHSVHQYLGQTVKSAGNNALADLVHSCLQSSRPSLLDLGGAKRLLLAIPTQVDVVDLARRIEQVVCERVSVSLEQEGDVKLCYEIEDLPWEGIQNKLIRQRHDCRELAARLHTRINVDWTVS